jgi:D-alanyl-D-alanine dipeptidase
MLVAVVIAQLAAATCTVSDAKQLVVVVTEGWNASSGLLFTFERRSARAQWMPKLDRQPIFVGRKGLAWGRGVLQMPAAKGPTKREGDQRSPAGMFRLGAVFGTELEAVKTHLIKEPVEGRICVDDPKSTHYAERLATKGVDRDWKSHEELASYRRAIVVEHNADRKTAAGSCIFVHDGVEPTEGCAAGDSWTIDQLLTWLRPDACPLLVQLPRADYQRLTKPLKLPSLRYDAKVGCCSN